MNIPKVKFGMRKFLYIFLLAALVRVLFFSVTAMQGTGEFSALLPRFDGYYEISQNLLKGNGFSWSVSPPFIPNSVRTPLYPLFISALIFIFKTPFAVLVAQIIAGSLIPLLAFRIAKQLIDSERIATAAAIFLSLEPLTVLLSLTLLTETLFTVLFLAGITCFLDYLRQPEEKMLAYSSLLLACGTLTKPTTQYLPLLILMIVWWLYRTQWKTALRHSLIVGLCSLLILGPWSIRNLFHFGTPSLSVQPISNLYAYLIPSTIALEEGIGFSKAQEEFNRGVGGIKNIEDITLANAKIYKKRFPSLLLAHPVGLLKSVGVTVFTFFTHDGYLDVLGRLHIDPKLRLERPAFTLLFESPKKAVSLVVSLSKSPALLIILGRILWALITIFFAIGVIKLIKTPEHRAKGVFILLLVAYFVFTTVAVGLAVNARFRVPVNALVFIFTVYGASGLLSSIQAFAHKYKKAEVL